MLHSLIVATFHIHVLFENSVWVWLFHASQRTSNIQGWRIHHSSRFLPNRRTTPEEIVHLTMVGQHSGHAVLRERRRCKRRRVRWKKGENLVACVTLAKRTKRRREGGSTRARAYQLSQSVAHLDNACVSSLSLSLVFSPVVLLGALRPVSVPTLLRASAVHKSSRRASFYPLVTSVPSHFSLCGGGSSSSSLSPLFGGLSRGGEKPCDAITPRH